MLVMLWSQVRFRRGRLVATLTAVAFAVASFSLLTSAAQGSQTRAVGTVRQNYRPLYDLLVRPQSAVDRKSTRLNSSHNQRSRMPSSA